MNKSRMIKQLATLLVPLAAACAVNVHAAEGGPVPGTVDLNGTGNLGRIQGGQTDNAGNAVGANESLESLPPTAAGNTVDSAPSTFNPDKGPHTLHRDAPRDRHGNTIDPNVVNGAMDGEGLSGVPSRHNPR